MDKLKKPVTQKEILARTKYFARLKALKMPYFVRHERSEASLNPEGRLISLTENESKIKEK